MKLRTMLNGTNRAGILPPLHKAESSCKATTIQLGVAWLVDWFSMFPEAAIPLLLLISQLKENVLKTDALGTVVQYRYLHGDQSRQYLVPQTLFRLSVLDEHLFEFDVQPAECFVRSLQRDSQNTRNAPKRFLSLRDELFSNAYLHVVVAGLMHDLGHRTRDNDLARSQYDHLVPHLLYLREKMAAQDNASAVIARDAFQQYEQLLLAPWVQSEGRFVQKQERRLVDERPGDPQSLPHPATIGRYQGSRPVLQSHLPQESCGTLLGFRLSLAIEPAEVREVFSAGYVLGKTMALRQDAYDLADLVRSVVADASDRETTRGGLQDGRKNPDSSSLPGPIGSEKSHDPAWS